MTRALDIFLREHLKPKPLPSMYGARLVVMRPSGTATLGRTDYDLSAQRGAFPLGELRWSNQWSEYSWIYLPYDTPINQAIVAEVHALLSVLNRRARHRG